MKRQAWTSHVFNLGIDPGWTNNVMTRVEDTGLRLAHYCKNMSDAQLSYKNGEGWSIKEHIGHLIDLEVLHHDRVKQFASLLPELLEADMSNARTQAANHNNRSLDALLDEFNRVRANFIKDFKGLSNESLNHQAKHPRLKVPMRAVDLLFFCAEHDDHHIATIKEIMEALNVK